MDFENEKNYDEKPASEQNTSSREGYTTAGNGFQRDYRGRSPRPRIHTAQRPPYNQGGERQGFNRQPAEEGGFRPEGFGAGLQSNAARQQNYRPRPRAPYGRQQDNEGYQGGYGQHRTTGIRFCILHPQRYLLTQIGDALLWSFQNICSVSCVGDLDHRQSIFRCRNLSNRNTAVT
jgi:hypothetical protein